MGRGVSLACSNDLFNGPAKNMAGSRDLDKFIKQSGNTAGSRDLVKTRLMNVQSGVVKFLSAKALPGVDHKL